MRNLAKYSTLAALITAAVLFLLASGGPKSPAPAKHPAQQVSQVALFIGDSYTVGEWAKPLQKGFAYLVAQHFGWQSVNFAVRGTGYLRGDAKDSHPRITGCGVRGCPTYRTQLHQAFATDLNPRVVVVSGGRNDSLSPRLQPEIARFYGELKLAYPNAQLIVTSPLWFGSNLPRRITTIAGLVKAAAEKVGAKYLDLGQPLMGHPEYMVSDGIHPNTEGHRVIANLVIARVAALQSVYGKN